MRRKSKESKINVVLTAALVVFVCLLSFSIGVISGKGWSDREKTVQFIEADNHLKVAEQDTEPLGDEMTQKEVELLTQRALEEAKAQSPEQQRQLRLKEENQPATSEQPLEQALDETPEAPAQMESDKVSKSQDAKEKGSSSATEAPKGRDASTAKVETAKERQVSSIPSKPSVPKPTEVDFTVQVAAYKSLAEAELHSQKLIDKGFPAFPVKAMIKGNLWYRVSIGSFKSRKQAMVYQKELKKQAVVKGTIVQKIERLKK